MNQIEEAIEYLKVKMDEVETPDEYKILKNILKYMLVPYILYDKDVLIEFEIDEIKTWEEYRDMQSLHHIPPSMVLSRDEWIMAKELLHYGKKELKNDKKNKI